MKNFKYSMIALAALSLTACDPMQDLYEDLDANKLPLNNTVAFTLSTADYKEMSSKALALASTKEDSVMAGNIAKQQAFNDTFKPSMLVPNLVAGKYSYLGFTSKAMVTYNVTQDVSKNVTKLEGLEVKPLVLADYQTVMGENSDVNFFTPLYPAEQNISTVLSNKFAEITKDTVMHIQYAFSTSEPVKEETTVILCNKDFEDGTDKSDVIPGWENIAVAGTKKWNNRTYSGNMYGDISAYGTTGAVETWLVSSAIAIENGTAPKLGFDVKIRFFKHAGLKVMISTDYTNDVKTATWDDVTALMNIPQHDQDPFVACSPVSLANYAGKNIHVAFVYEGDGANDKTTTYQIDNIQITERTVDFINPITVKDALVERYNGKWSFYKYGYAVSADEYAAMGANGSFKDQTTANTLLPILMGKVYPYAKEGDIRTIVYKVGSTTKVDEFMFSNGTFVMNNWIEVKTEQYVRNETEWIFDPSVSFDVSNEDYRIIVAWVKENKTPYMDPKYDNSEYYFGASYNYNNFNHTPAKLIASDNLGDKEFEGKDINVVMKERMIKCFAEVLLPVKYADAALLNGIDTYYTAKYIVYDGANSAMSMKFKLIGKGQFEYVAE
ncbi:MAG: choice-of-anchor J domain-containing protein [Bacteroidales bacterium]